MIHCHVYVPQADPLDPDDPEQMAPLQEGLEAKLGHEVLIDVHHRPWCTRTILMIEGGGLEPLVMG